LNNDDEEEKIDEIYRDTTNQCAQRLLKHSKKKRGGNGNSWCSFIVVCPSLGQPLEHSFEFFPVFLLVYQPRKIKSNKFFEKKIPIKFTLRPAG